MGYRSFGAKEAEKKRNGRFSEQSSRFQNAQLLWRLRFLRKFSIFRDFYLGILLFPYESYRPANILFSIIFIRELPFERD